MDGKSLVATRNRRLHNGLDLIWERGGKEGWLLEEGVVPTEPDMVAGVDAQTRDVLLEVSKFDSRFAKLVKSLKMCVILF